MPSLLRLLGLKSKKAPKNGKAPSGKELGILAAQPGDPMAGLEAEHVSTLGAAHVRFIS